MRPPIIEERLRRIRSFISLILAASQGIDEDNVTEGVADGIDLAAREALTEIEALSRLPVDVLNIEVPGAEGGAR